MLPTLSRLSVSYGPGSRLRHRCSSRSLQISPLHREFHFPLPSSSAVVSSAIPWLSQGLSHSTGRAACAPFTPSNSEQHSPPPYYRGCWHGVSRGFLWWYRRAPPLVAGGPSSHLTGVYNPKAVIPHAASLGQACAHCPRFPTAASRRSRDRLSIPVWLVVLSDQLPVVALVGHYPTN